MSFEQKGAYMELLMLQFHNGRFSEEDAKHVLRGHLDLWDKIRGKFSTDGKFFWKQRLEDEQMKRQKYSQSRRNNKNHVSHHMSPHMEDENKDDNSIEVRKKAFGLELAKYEQKYGKPMLTEFFIHWSEPNKRNTLMKFEMQKTWKLGGRLATWEINAERFNRGKGSSKPEIKVAAVIKETNNGTIIDYTKLRELSKDPKTKGGMGTEIKKIIG